MARSALFTTVPDRGRNGLAIAGLSIVFVLLTPWLLLCTSFSFVQLFCLSLVAILALGGAGTWMQLERARGHHPDEAVDGVRAVLRILVVFALVTPFWSLFDQKASTWVLAGAKMESWWLSPSQMQSINPALVMIIIPLNNFVLYPLLRKRGIELSALRRMTIGLFSAAASWVAIGCIQLVLDGGSALSLAWQILPYILLTFGEVMVSATGLEFAYSQAPPAMKGVIMSFWQLAVTIGNLWVLLVNSGVRNPSVIKSIESTGLSEKAFLFFFFAAFAFLSAIAFAFYAKRYKVVDHYRDSSPAQPEPQAKSVPEARVVKDGDK